MMHLPVDLFRIVVESTPLIALDLIVENPAGEILLGQRSNRPAQGAWFVPGGRVKKNERLDVAFQRLAREELGMVVQRDEASLLGVYEHLYEDSVFGEEPSTHYVVLGYQLTLDIPSSGLPEKQHNSYRWWPKGELVTSDSVHENTKAYFTDIR